MIVLPAVSDSEEVVELANLSMNVSFIAMAISRAFELPETKGCILLLVFSEQQLVLYNIFEYHV